MLNVNYAKQIYSAKLVFGVAKKSRILPIYDPNTAFGMEKFVQ